MELELWFTRLVKVKIVILPQNNYETTLTPVNHVLSFIFLMLPVTMREFGTHFCWNNFKNAKKNRPRCKISAACTLHTLIHDTRYGLEFGRPLQPAGTRRHIRRVSAAGLGALSSLSSLVSHVLYGERPEEAACGPRSIHVESGLMAAASTHKVRARRSTLQLREHRAAWSQS